MFTGHPVRKQQTPQGVGYQPSKQMKDIPPIKALRAKVHDATRPISGMNKLEVDFSVYVLKLFLYTPLRPMQVMFLWFILQIVSCLIIAQGGYWYVLGGVFLYQLSAILDNVDGQMARFYGQQSMLAMYMDQIYHWINYPLLFLALGYAADVFWLGVANAALFLYTKLFVFNPSIYNLRNERVEGVLKRIYWGPRQEGEATLIMKIYDLFRMSLLFNVLFFGVLFNLLKITLYIYLAVFLAEFIRKFVYTIKQFRNVDKELYGHNKNTDEKTS